MPGGARPNGGRPPSAVFVDAPIAAVRRTELLGQQASTPRHVGSAVGADCNNPWRPTCGGRETVGVQARLRTHEVALVHGLVRLRPFTEADWETAAVWQADPRVLWFSEGGFVDGRPLAETQGIYRGVSQSADVFVIERDGVPVGDGWVQAMNLPRITTRFTGLRTARIDLQLAYDVWGEGLGTRAIRLMTDHAFASGYDLVFAVDIADFNQRSRRAFLRCGYVPWRRVAQPPGSKSAYVHDLVCRPSLFYGTAPLQEHPGSDRIRAADAPFGAAIVVYRRTPELEVLLLHRAAGGPDHEGDWAWTPPAGARFPAEPIDDCAARELHEEIGVELSPRPVAVDEATGWAIYVSEVPPAVPIQLDAEHDRYEWQPVAASVGRCLPVSVGESIDRAMAGLR